MADTVSEQIAALSDEDWADSGGGGDPCWGLKDARALPTHSAARSGPCGARGGRRGAFCTGGCLFRRFPDA